MSLRRILWVGWSVVLALPGLAAIFVSSPSLRCLTFVEFVVCVCRFVGVGVLVWVDLSPSSVALRSAPGRSVCLVVFLGRGRGSAVLALSQLAAAIVAASFVRCPFHFPGARWWVVVALPVFVAVGALTCSWRWSSSSSVMCVWESFASCGVVGPCLVGILRCGFARSIFVPSCSWIRVVGAFPVCPLSPAVMWVVRMSRCRGSRVVSGVWRCSCFEVVVIVCLDLLAFPLAWCLVLWWCYPGGLVAGPPSSLLVHVLAPAPRPG